MGCHLSMLSHGSPTPVTVAEAPAESTVVPPGIGRLGIEHFRDLCVLGSGAFGSVLFGRLTCNNTEEANVYAVKRISKQSIAKRKHQKREVNMIFNERNFLAFLNSRFICNLHFAFQDDEHMQDPRNATHALPAVRVWWAYAFCRALAAAPLACCADT